MQLSLIMCCNMSLILHNSAYVCRFFIVAGEVARDFTKRLQSLFYFCHFVFDQCLVFLCWNFSASEMIMARPIPLQSMTKSVFTKSKPISVKSWELVQGGFLKNVCLICSTIPFSVRSCMYLSNNSCKMESFGYIQP